VLFYQGLRDANHSVYRAAVLSLPAQPHAIKCRQGGAYPKVATQHAERCCLGYGFGFNPPVRLAKRLITRITRSETPPSQAKGCVALTIGASAMQSVLLQKSYSLNEFARQNDASLLRELGASS
jgi:hypothetical protein